MRDVARNQLLTNRFDVTCEPHEAECLTVVAHVAVRPSPVNRRLHRPGIAIRDWLCRDSWKTGAKRWFHRQRKRGSACCIAFDLRWQPKHLTHHLVEVGRDKHVIDALACVCEACVNVLRMDMTAERADSDFSSRVEAALPLRDYPCWRFRRRAIVDNDLVRACCCVSFDSISLTGIAPLRICVAQEEIAGEWKPVATLLAGEADCPQVAPRPLSINLRVEV